MEKIDYSKESALSVLKQMREFTNELPGYGLNVGQELLVEAIGKIIDRLAYDFAD